MNVFEVSYGIKNKKYVIAKDDKEVIDIIKVYQKNFFEFNHPKINKITKHKLKNYAVIIKDDKITLNNYLEQNPLPSIINHIVK